MEDIWNYYKEVADKTTVRKTDKNGRPVKDNFSLTFFYGENSRAADQNQLVRAFWGDPAADLHRIADNNPEDIECFLSAKTEPCHAQREAIVSVR